MAITRGQMQRELYGIGSYFPPENGREKFGLGSKLKRFVRKIIPNEVAEVAVKAAPFVAPFNPLLAGGMSALGTFDQTGRIGQSVKAGLINYGLGQGARYIGGAGFQEGINPFAGVDFSQGIMSGLGQTFTSPISGQPLFGQAATPTQQISLGTGDASAAEAFYADSPATAASRDFAAGTGQFGDTYYTLSPLEQAEQAKAIAQAQTSLGSSYLPAQEVTFKQAAGNLVDSIRTGDLGQLGQSLKNLGGKAVQAIYTNKDGSIDKFAVAATIAGGASYMEAKQLAEEAELVDDADQYTEEMYNADKQKFLDLYSKRLPDSAFGFKQGGRVGFAFGSEPESREGITSITLSKEEDNDDKQVASLTNNRISQLLGLLESPNLDDDYRKQIQEEIDMLMKKYAMGGRVNYKDGKDPFDRVEDKIVSINPLQDDLDSQLGIGAAALAPGLMKLMSRGAPKFTSAEKTLVIKNLAGRSKGKPEYKELGVSIPEAKKIMDNPAANLKDATILKEFVKMLMGKKDGGRIGFAGGTTKAKSIKKLYAEDYYDPDEHVIAELAEEFMREGLGQTRAYLRAARELGYFDKKDGGIINARQAYAMGSEVPLRQNEAGVTEMDFRNTGGFVPPIGVKEKADDIPAMLSNNEFVFTADAVRAAGGGSVNKGAQKMYALMKQLEGKMA